MIVQVKMPEATRVLGPLMWGANSEIGLRQDLEKKDLVNQREKLKDMPICHQMSHASIKL